MSQDTLKELSSLCQQLRSAEREATDLLAKAAAKAKDIQRLTEEDIPALMTELAVQKIVLESGETITVGLEVYASIPAANKEEAFKWLVDNQHGGLIKTDLTLAFGREELDKAKALALKLSEEEGLDPVIDQSVHANTLKAFIKGQLADGKPIPLELFGARSVQKAKIK